MTSDEALAIVRKALKSVIDNGSILECVAEVERAVDHIAESLWRLDDLDNS